MSSRLKWTLLTLGVYALFAAATALEIYGTFVRPGFLTVYVSEKQPVFSRHVYFSIPAVIPNMALGLIPASEIRDHVCLDGEEAAWGQVAAAVSTEMEKAPDFTIVEVKDAEANVRIEKKNQSIHIRVDSPDATVHVVVPQATVRAATDLIGDV